MAPAGLVASASFDGDHCWREGLVTQELGIVGKAAGTGYRARHWKRITQRLLARNNRLPSRSSPPLGTLAMQPTTWANGGGSNEGVSARPEAAHCMCAATTKLSLPCRARHASDVGMHTGVHIYLSLCPLRPCSILPNRKLMREGAQGCARPRTTVEVGR